MKHSYLLVIFNFSSTGSAASADSPFSVHFSFPVLFDCELMSSELIFYFMSEFTEQFYVGSRGFLWILKALCYFHVIPLIGLLVLNMASNSNSIILSSISLGFRFLEWLIFKFYISKVLNISKILHSIHNLKEAFFWYLYLGRGWYSNI